MIFGYVDPTAFALDFVDSSSHADITVGVIPVGLAKLTAKLDGLGSGVGPVVFKATVRDQAATPNVLGTSSEVEVLDRDAARWVDFPLSPFKLTEYGVYTLTVEIVSGDDTSARAWVVPQAGLSISSYPLASFLTAFVPFIPPATESETYFGRLPFPDAETKLSEAVSDGTVYRARAGWHGTILEREVGAFCVVNRDGALSGLVGKRLRVTSTDQPRQRSVTVYCNAATALIEEDISLSRRAFTGIAPLSSFDIGAKVEVLT